MKIIEGTIAAPKGFYADGQHVGLKYKNKDLGWIYSAVPAQAAAVFTTNHVQAAPIQVTKTALADGEIQAVIVNSGNANACTGEAGLRAAQKMQQQCATALDLPVEKVAIASTGVIGQPFPSEKVAEGILQLRQVEGESYGFHEAILTTDTSTKEIVVSTTLGGQTVTMAGVAKGSGMIHPNMATMLSFITTDANLPAELLQQALREITEVTFNQITVDGDTSTNDMVLVLANGLAENAVIEPASPEYLQFKAMLQLVCETLAKKIAQDGEGATKLIQVTVTNAENSLDARMIAKKIVGSPLVKTAMFGQDPNWGRIICAAGYAGPMIEPTKVDIFLGDICVLQQGTPQEYNEAKMQKTLSQSLIPIKVDLHLGTEQGMAWGCDLSYEYVKINALYHT